MHPGWTFSGSGRRPPEGGPLDTASSAAEPVRLLADPRRSRARLSTMLHEPRRREFLRALSAGAVALAGSPLFAGADTVSEVTRLASGVSLVRGPGGGNIVVAEAADALLLVNGDQ